jgi:hypothetical protein
MVQPDRQHANVTRHMRFECLIPKSTNTHSEYVIPLYFPQQQWFQDRPYALCYTFIATCLYPQPAQSSLYPIPPPVDPY